MTSQFSLPGFDPPPDRLRPAKALRVARPKHSLFFGVSPAPGDLEWIDSAASALRQRHGATNGLVSAGRLHVTCCDLGDFGEAPPSALVDAAIEAAAGLVVPCFEIVFEQVLRFKGSQALVLLEGDGAAGLAAFRAALGSALSEAGLGVDSGGTPHMTLGYGGDKVSEALAEPIRWVARDFVLIHSLVGKGEHRHLGRWPLVPQP